MPNLDLDTLTTQTIQPSDQTFTLGGRTWTLRDRDDIPVGVITRVLRLPEDDLQSVDGIAGALPQLEAFLRNILMPDEADDFLVLLESGEVNATGRTMDGLYQLLLEHALGRPLKPVSDSSPTRKSTGRKSAAGSSSRGKRRSA